MDAIFSPEFRPARLDQNEIIFNFIGNSLLLTEDGRIPETIESFTQTEPAHRLIIGRSEHFVFGMRVWPAATLLPAHLRTVDFRGTMDDWPQAWVDAACRGRQLATWLSENRFCGVCGSLMETDAIIAARRCPECDHLAFPRLSPVGIVLVTRGPEVLLARSPHFRKGMYSVLAGYVEAGESIEECIHREVREEVGITITNLRWFGSQSWPLTNALMLGFLADYADGSLALQEDEIEDAQWFPRDNLPPLPHHSTIAFRLIQSYLR